MQTLTVKVQPDTIESLDDEAEEQNVTRSEYVRMILDERKAAEGLREENEQLQRRLDELRSQLAATNKRVDDVTEIVEYVEEEKSWRSAGLFTRTRWWLFGRDR